MHQRALKLLQTRINNRPSRIPESRAAAGTGKTHPFPQFLFFFFYFPGRPSKKLPEKAIFYWADLRSLTQRSLTHLNIALILGRASGREPFSLIDVIILHICIYN